MTEIALQERRFHSSVTHWVQWALDLAPDEDRAARLRHELGDQPELLSQVLALVAAESEAGTFLESPVLCGLPLEPPALVGSLESLGPYRILRPIGQGGMGTVYLAERADRQYEKRVAIKIADRPGSPEVQRRLEAERSILARLEHPNIARLYDSGTVQGVPYFVMELVDGIPIDRYCRLHGLGLGARVDLFVGVCRAVEHAHRSLVVHRDLKPGNVLVTVQGEPKLLDFGLAKLLDPAAAAPEATRGGLRPLTPEYASPEQLLGEPITLASDVYSLGAVLYRMLSGELPRSIASLEPSKLARALAQDPPPLCGRSRAAGRGPAVDADVEAIVLKALAVEPARRYGSVSELLADLERYKAGEPVRARPPTAWYRAGKFARRHRAGLAAVTGVLAVVCAALLLVLAQMREVALQRNEARRSQARAEGLSALLVDVLREADPSRSGGENVTLREALDRGVSGIETRSGDDPELRALQLAAVGSIYRELGAYDEALRFTGAAVELREAGGQPLPLARALVRLGTILNDQGSYREAQASLHRAVTLLGEHLGGSHREVAQALEGLGWSQQQLGHYEAAEASLRRALAIFTRHHGEGSAEVASARLRLGQLQWVTGRLADAAESLLAAADVLARSGDRYRAELGLARENLGVLALVSGDLDAAERWLLASLEVRTESLGPAGTARADSLFMLARLYRARGELSRAERAVRRSLELAAGNPTRVMAAEVMAGILLDRGEVDAAERELTGLVERLGDGGFGDHPVAARVLGSLAAVQLRKGDRATALDLLRQALSIRQRSFPADHFLVGESQLALGRCLLEAGKPDRAEPLLAAAQDLLQRAFGPEDARALAAGAALRLARTAAAD